MMGVVAMVGSQLMSGLTNVARHVLAGERPPVVCYRPEGGSSGWS